MEELRSMRKEGTAEQWKDEQQWEEMKIRNKNQMTKKDCSNSRSRTKFLCAEWAQEILLSYWQKKATNNIKASIDPLSIKGRLTFIKQNPQWNLKIFATTH